MKFTPTQKQKKAFEDVIKAIEKAQKTGLQFFGKQWSLVAYRKEAVKYFYEDNNPNDTCCSGCNTIPHLSSNVLRDSGADDFPCFLNTEDEEKFS